MTESIVVGGEQYTETVRFSIPIEIGPEFVAVRRSFFESINKHGELPNDASASGLILSEEILEAVEAGLKVVQKINDLRDGKEEVNCQAMRQFYKELSQNAAVCVKIMHKLRKDNPEVGFFL